MSLREVEAVRAHLASIARNAALLAAQVEDLYVLAYDRPASSEVKVAGTGAPDPITGDLFAKKLFASLAGRSREADDILKGFTASVGNLLNVGSVDDSLWGTRISAAEFGRALKAQGRRRARGDYTPTRNVAQPRHPRKGDKR